MKGSKYLSEMIDIQLLKKNKLNIIKAPTGSGKTYFALQHIPSLTENALHKVVYLIDTINGKEQILNNYNAIAEYFGWATSVGWNHHSFEKDDYIVVMTYAKFGVLCQKNTDFFSNFEYIICDELHSLIKFQNFSPRPNNHSVALMQLKSAVRNDRTTVIALSATPDSIKKEFGAEWFEFPIDQEELIHYDQDQVIPFTNLEYILSGIEKKEIGLCYSSRIQSMVEIQAMAAKMGLFPICIWSIANTKNQMKPNQLVVRDTILQDFKIPEDYNLLIINSSSETSIKIKSHVDYVIVNNSNQDTQVQVRGRVNGDLKTLYLLNDGTQKIDLPDEFLETRLFTEGKDRLCDFLNFKNPSRKQYKWPTVKTLLIESGYIISEGRDNNLRYAVISPPDE